MSFRPSKPGVVLPAFRFAVSFAEQALPEGEFAPGGVAQIVAGFSEVSGLEASIELHEQREGGLQDRVHRFATRSTFGNLTLRRGVSLGVELWAWYEQVRGGSFGARRSLLIAQLDERGEPAHVWYAYRALPARYVGPSWSASQSAVAVEALEIAHEGLELVPAQAFGSPSLLFPDQ